MMKRGFSGVENTSSLFLHDDSNGHDFTLYQFRVMETQGSSLFLAMECPDRNT